RAMNENEQSATLNLIADVVNMPIVQASEIPGGKQTLYDHGRAAYEWLREGTNDKVLPLYLGIYLTASNQALHVDITATAKPSEMSMQLGPAEPKDYIDTESVSMRPAFYTQNLPLSRFIFDRKYGVDGRSASKPTVKISFGSMIGRDARAITMCRQRCDQIGSAGPEYLYRYAPTVKVKLRAPEYVSGKSYKAFSAGVSKVNDHLTLYVLMNEVVFDLSGEEAVVIPEKSHLPLIMQLTSPF